MAKQIELKIFYSKHKRLFNIFFFLCAIAIVNLIVSYMFYATPLSSGYHEFGHSAPSIEFFVEIISYISFVTLAPHMFLDNAIFGTRATITRQIFDTLPVRFLTTLITLFLYAQIINLSIKLLDIFFKKFNIKINNTLVKKIVYILIIGMVFLGSSIKIEHAVFGRGETYKSKEELCNEIQASYLNTVIKTQRLAPVDNEYQMALYVEGNLYNLCMIDLNEKKLREFKLSDINQLPLFVSEQPRNKIIEYTVGNTEAIKDVANKFNISVETIRWENQLETDDVYVGQTIRILPVTGVSHKVVKGDTIYSVAKKYHTDPQKISDYPYNKFANNETLTLIPDEILIIPEGVK